MGMDHKTLRSYNVASGGQIILNVKKNHHAHDRHSLVLACSARKAAQLTGWESAG